MRGSIGLLVSSSLLLSACAINPPQLNGKFADPSAAQTSTDKLAGTNVRWGGRHDDGRTIDG